MLHNDTLRSLRYALGLDDTTVLEMFASGGAPIDRAQLAAFFRREDEAGFVELPDELFGAFLDGFIVAYRGRRERRPGQAAPAPAAMNNNRILRAIRIALQLEDRDIISMMDAAGMRISKSELSALFRSEGHRNYRPCGDQFLRNFLRGLATTTKAHRSNR